VESEAVSEWRALTGRGLGRGLPEAESFSKNMHKIVLNVTNNFKNLAVCTLQPTLKTISS